MSAASVGTTEKEAHFEFGGPIGASLITISLPFVVLGLCFVCGKDYCLQGLQFNTLAGAVEQLPSSWGDLFSPVAFTICLQWLLFQVLLDRVLPGKTVDGVVLQDGSRLPYKMNGHAAFWTTFLVISLGLADFGGLSSTRLKLSALYELYEELAVAAALISFALSIGLYLASYRRAAKLADAAGTVGRSAMYDFFIGRELNPRIGPLDLKFFCELRPGLLGWVVINLGMLLKQKEMQGYVSASMIMVNVLQGLYVWDSLFFERAILTTMDITTEGFGFMLAFGDLCWVPFTYSLQAHYLVTNDPQLPLWTVGLISCVCLAGYAIFRLKCLLSTRFRFFLQIRGANSQKDAFRRDPNASAVSHLQWIPTARGTKLLTSGWWGAARKINYTGDWVMGLSWCMFAGTNSPVPYFYCIYFGVLLVHRALRDDGACAAKYGPDWITYKQKVPSMFVPGLF
ncbi:unnamed protein product [Hapterophycus canaliculatus]